MDCVWTKSNDKVSSFPETAVQKCSSKKVFLEISQNSQGNTCSKVSYLIKLQAWAYNFVKKETLAQVFACEFCEISHNTFSYRAPFDDCFRIFLRKRKNSLLEDRYIQSY